MANHFEPNIANYGDYFVLIGSLQINGVRPESNNFEIGVFCGDECRGSDITYPFSTSSGTVNYLRVDINVYGNAGDEFDFVLFDIDNNIELGLISPSSITYNADGYGSRKNPHVLNFTSPVFTLDIEGYGTGSGKYYLIAPPYDVEPDQVKGINVDGDEVDMIREDGNYDLYYFDQSKDKEWINYKSGDGSTDPGFSLISGKGYLYANMETIHLKFPGEPYSGEGTVILAYDPNAEFKGWNLVGNPFAEAAFLPSDRSFYVMNSDGNGLTTGDGTINAMQGVFVEATEDGESLTFQKGEGNKNIEKISLDVCGGRGNVIDRAVVRFDNCTPLHKFTLTENCTKVYIPNDNLNYAVVNSARENSMPINFKAENGGSYTLSVNLNNVEMKYLHLVDRITGADVDLLTQPNYQFNANVGDSESRFVLNFKAMTGVEENSQRNFCFVNGSDLYFCDDVEGAEINLIDMAGRTVLHQMMSGSSISLSNLSQGVYVVRLSGKDNTMTQKIVVK